MTALQKIVLGTPPAAVDGDPVRTASTKANANVDVLNSQATLSSFATTLTGTTALTAAHIGKRVNVNVAAGGQIIYMPTAASGGADNLILIRNTGTVAFSLGAAAAGEVVSLGQVNGGESALMDTDGVHTWGCLCRGRSSSANEAVQGTLTVGGNVTAPNFAGTWINTQYILASTTVNGGTVVSAIPNGTGALGQFNAYGSSNTGASQVLSMYSTGGANIIHSHVTGAGTANPLDIYVNGLLNTRFFYDGTVGINAPVPGIGGAGVTNIWSATYQLVLRNTGAAAGACWLIGPNNANNIVVFNQSLTGCYIANGATAWAGQSDERLKNIRSEITGAVDAIKDIRTVRYTWKSDDDHAEALGVENDSRIYVGVIAQDVKKHVPEAVSISHDDYLGVAYTDLVPLCMAAIKELSEKLDSANSAIAALQARPA